MARFRALKTELRSMLEQPDWEASLQHIAAMPAAQTVGPLMSFFLFGGEMKWRAVTAFGLVMGKLAQEDLEQARIIMRRLLWHMNEESGNIGWGIAEAMAEAMINSQTLANEYNRMLHSYIRETSDDDNYLDHPPLRRGVYWGLGRMAKKYPELIRPSVRALSWGLQDEDPEGRGLSAWALGFIGTETNIPALKSLLDDTCPVELFENRKVHCTSVAQLAQQAIEHIQSHHTVD
ncbi:DVU0298 family protein [Halodesulfovibrio aestuarii]|uniref:DVU0298 family protein n=1 Tax=Halodesulfovibrio aestuarii TaxID=126333 RepID=A0ABV4JV73_9BACT